MDTTLSFPSASTFPVVIFCHGFNGCKDDFKDIAALLRENGIGSLSFTFCGSGPRDQSGFATTEMTLFTEREDLFAAMDFVKALPQFCGQLFLFGGSQGGMVCTMAAQARPSDISAMALLFPALCIPDNWNARFPHEDDIPDETDLWGVRLGRAFFQTLRGPDIYAGMSEFQKPVLIMHGTKDEIVPVSYSERAAKAFPHAEFILYEGEKHGFGQDALKNVAQRFLAFVQKTVSCIPNPV